MKSAASVTPEEREKVHKLCAFPWGVSAIPDEVKRMLAEDVDDDPSSAEESEELDFSCSSSSAAASNPNDPQATKAVSSSVAEEVLPVSFASASFAGKEAEGKNDAGACSYTTGLLRSLLPWRTRCSCSKSKKRGYTVGCASKEEGPEGAERGGRAAPC